MHLAPEGRFYRKIGCYKPKCRPEPVQRYRCKRCRRSFSYQTFRVDYRDRRPEVNHTVFYELASGMGLRQCARHANLSSRGVQWKFRKLARSLALLNQNLIHELPAGHTFLLDEAEDFVESSILKVTMPVLIEKESMLIVATDVAPIRRRTRAGSRRERWLRAYELKHGQREDKSRLCVHGVLARWKQLLGDRHATLLTDLKSSYVTAVRDLFGEQVEHLRTPSVLPRTVQNPLFRINLTEAMLRDNLGRLRRRTWLHSKDESCLRLHLELFGAYRNWVRKRFNKDDKGQTPGVVLGLIDTSLDKWQVVAWRQDWGERSIHPASLDGHRTVRQPAA